MFRSMEYMLEVVVWRRAGDDSIAPRERERDGVDWGGNYRVQQSGLGGGDSDTTMTKSASG